MRRVALLVLSAPLVSAQSQPTFYAAYQDGLEAERLGHWRAAVTAFERAVALRPASASRVITYGNNLLTDYAPYTHLAHCHLELGEWGAVHAMLEQAAAHHEPKGERDRLAAALEARTAPRPAEPAKHEVPRVDPPPAPVVSPAPVTGVQEPHHPPSIPRPEPELPKEETSTPKGPGRPTRPLLPPAPARVKPEERPIAAPSVGPVEPSKPQRAEPSGASTKGWAWGLTAAAALGLAWALRRRETRTLGLGDPKQLGPYRIERLLGRGGFASTYLARHGTTQMPVALKRLHPYRHEDREFRDRFHQETQLGMRLDHPNLVRVLDSGTEEEVPWLAMTFVSGERLDQRLKGRGPLPLPEVLDIAQGIAGAMAHAHGLGIVHRDLKPGNVMFEGDQVKVVDFGIARTMDSHTLTTTYAFLGTPLYAAPEAQLKTQVGPAADRYAFGIMLFEMVAGAPPFTGETPFEILDQHRSRPLPDLAALSPGTPPALVDLILRLGAKDPAARPEDEEILAILASLTQD